MRSVDDELETAMSAVAGYLAAADDLIKHLYPDSRFDGLGLAGRTQVSIELAGLIQREAIAGRSK